MMTNYGNRVTQGQFSFMPDLSDEQISAQIKYALDNGWAINIEYTDDPHPRNTYWEMFGMPMFDIKDPAGILMEINDCRKTFPHHYIRGGVESPKMSYLVNRPEKEPGYHLIREERDGRSQGYTIVPYSNEKPEGERY